MLSLTLSCKHETMWLVLFQSLLIDYGYMGNIEVVFSDSWLLGMDDRFDFVAERLRRICTWTHYIKPI